MKPFLISLLSVIAPMLTAGLVEKPVEYTSGDVTCEGWAAYDDATATKRPAVLIVHQWTGVSDNEKMRARMLAELGYNVFVADVYGIPQNPKTPCFTVLNLKGH